LQIYKKYTKYKTYKNKFVLSYKFYIENKENIAWDELYECDIIIKYNIDILLLKEILLSRKLCSACGIYNKKKILQSRDPLYFRHKCW
jgi:hypothetical protein